MRAFFLIKRFVNATNIIYLRSINKIYYHMIEGKIENTTERYRRLRIILGEEFIKKDIESSFDYIIYASKGIRADIIKNFIKNFNVSQEITANFLNISSPTIYRWIKNKKKLERNYSVKIFEIAELFLYGSDVFESNENFTKWLKLPNTALGGMEPIELLEIPGGVSKVNDIIGRIEHGVYS